MNLHTKVATDRKRLQSHIVLQLLRQLGCGCHNSKKHKKKRATLNAIFKIVYITSQKDLLFAKRVACLKNLIKTWSDDFKFLSFKSFCFIFKFIKKVIVRFSNKKELF